MAGSKILGTESPIKYVVSVKPYLIHPWPGSFLLSIPRQCSLRPVLFAGRFDACSNLADFDISTGGLYYSRESPK